jgi:hypothetical protein
MQQNIVLHKRTILTPYMSKTLYLKFIEESMFKYGTNTFFIFNKKIATVITLPSL